MKNKVLCLLLICVCLFGFAGCGSKSIDESNKDGDKSVEKVEKVGKLDLVVEAVGEFHDGLAKVKQGGKFGFMDKLGNIVIEPEYRMVGDFYDGLAPACTGQYYSDQKCGYIDNKGNTVIDFKYGDARDFSFGYGVVKSGINDIVVDKKGNEIMNFTHSYIYNFGPIANDLFVVPAKDALRGLAIVDKSGNVIMDGIAGFGQNIDGLINVHQICEGVGNFWNDGKWGFIDEKGKLVIDFQYDYAGSYVDGLAPVVKDGKYGYINKDNKYVIEPTFEYKNVFDLPVFSDGLLVVYEKPNVIVYNTKGEKVFEKSDDYVIQSFKNGYAEFKKDGKAGYLDKKGNVAIKNQYRMVFDFSDGLSRVYLNYDDDKDTGEFEFINTDGKTILAGKKVEHASISSSNNESNSSEKDDSKKDNDSSSSNESKKDNESSSKKSDDKKDSTSNDKKDNNSNSDKKSDAKESSSSNNGATSTGIKVGSYNIKYGTYNGDAAATGETLVLKEDGTATLNGEKYTYKVGKYNFAQDSSSDAYEDCLILEGSYTYHYYVLNNGKTLSQGSGIDYNYSE